MPDLSREGPFDVLQDHPDSGASPRILDGMPGCQYPLTSYDEEHGGPDFTPTYGVQLYDPRLLEYAGAPNSYSERERHGETGAGATADILRRPGTEEEVAANHMLGFHLYTADRQTPSICTQRGVLVSSLLVSPMGKSSQRSGLTRMGHSQRSMIPLAVS